jgi:hypothetical protein
MELAVNSEFFSILLGAPEERYFAVVQLENAPIASGFFLEEVGVDSEFGCPIQVLELAIPAIDWECPFDTTTNAFRGAAQILKTPIEPIDSFHCVT